MRRFFVSKDALNRDPVLLDHEESRHLVRVLRMQPSERVELFDGSGALYTGTIDRLGKQVAVKVESRTEISKETQEGSVIVCQGDLKGGKMDFLVEKCTELGVVRFIAFTSLRSQGRLDQARQKQRWQRRQTIVKKSCKQSGRLRFMQVDEEMGFVELLATDLGLTHGKYFLWEKAEGLTLAEALVGEKVLPVGLMIGPEGGFSDEEAAQAQSSGWQPVSLGHLILRAETATIAAVAITNHLLGRM